MFPCVSLMSFFSSDLFPKILTMPHTKAAKTSAWSAPQVTLCQDAPFFQLPIEVLAVISDFVQSKAFCRTCLKTWAALRGRHLVMNVNPDNAKRRIAQVKKAVAFRTLRLQMDRVGNVSSDNDSFLRLLRVLQDKPHLQSLNLDLWPYTSHDGVISAVVDLKGLRSVALTARDTLQVLLCPPEREVFSPPPYHCLCPASFLPPCVPLLCLSLQSVLL